MGLMGQMQFEGATKPDAISVDSYENTLSAGRVMGLPSNQQELVNLVSSSLIYIGTAGRGFPTTSGTDNDSTKPNWMVQKITISSTSITTQIGWGRWSNRAGLTYA